MLSSIINIESVNQNNNSFGTGFVIHNDGKGIYILTCKHVLDDVNEPMVEEVVATVVAQSDFIDMAVIYVPKVKLTALPLQINACSSLDVDVIGFSHFIQNLTQKKYIYATLFQDPIEIHSSINEAFYRVRRVKANDDFNFERGNSGSPVFCRKSGHVIAMISNKEGQDIAYAIEIANVEKIWENIPSTLLKKKTFIPRHSLNVKYKIGKFLELLPKKTRKKVRYVVAGVISILLLSLSYFFFTITQNYQITNNNYSYKIPNENKNIS